MALRVGARFLLDGFLLFGFTFGLVIPTQSLLGCQFIAANNQESLADPLKAFSRAIIDAKATERIKDKLYETAVFHLVRRGDIEAISALGKRGEELVFRDKNDNTLVHAAV